jgi:hypothetical protein
MHLPLGKHSDDDELPAVPAKYEIFIRYAWYLPLYHGSIAWDRDTLPHRDWKRHNEFHVGIGAPGVLPLSVISTVLIGAVMAGLHQRYSRRLGLLVERRRNCGA